MKVKITCRTIMRYIILFLVMIECDYFTFLNLPIISDYYTRNFVIAFLSIFLFIWCEFFTKKALDKDIKKKIKIKALVIMTFVCMTICAFYYVLICGKADNVLINIAPFFCVLLTYPIIYIMKNPKQSKKLWNGICAIVFISLLIRSKIVWDYYNTGIISNETLLIPNGGIKLRYGILKIYPTSLGAFVVVITFAKGIVCISKNRFKGIAILSLSILGYLYFAFLYQGRSWTFLLALIFFLIVICKKDKLDKKIMAIALGIVVIIYLVFSGTVDSFFESFLRGSQYWHSTELRIEGVSYIISNILSHPFGNGFTTEFVMNGKTFYPDDYGALESLYRFGYMGLILLILYYRCLIKCYRATNNNSKTIIFSVVIYFIFGSLIFDTFIIRRIFAIPFVLGLVGGISGQAPVRENKEGKRVRHR